jgi:hypothetical protein
MHLRLSENAPCPLSQVGYQGFGWGREWSTMRVQEKTSTLIHSHSSAGRWNCPPPCRTQEGGHKALSLQNPARNSRLGVGIPTPYQRDKVHSNSRKPCSSAASQTDKTTRQPLASFAQLWTNLCQTLSQPHSTFAISFNRAFLLFLKNLI